MESIGERIKTARICLGLSQTQLAELSGITQATISMIENGVREPKSRNTKKIAKGLGLTSSDLIGDGHGQGPLTQKEIAIWSIAGKLRRSTLTPEAIAELANFIDKLDSQEYHEP